MPEEPRISLISRKRKPRKNQHSAETRKPKKTMGKGWKRAFFAMKLLLFTFIFLSLAGAGVFYGIYRHYSQGLPKISTLADYQPPTVTTVYDVNGQKIGEFYRERRIVIPLSQMPHSLLEAFIAAEDARFYKHQGVDLISIIRAFIRNVQAGAIVQGGSTITQQVTKSFFLSPEKKLSRKIKEAILAYRIDRNFTKNEILYLYLNQIYLGHGAYGVEAAAQNYFGKHAKDLSLAECAMLAGLPQAPSKYSPFRNPKRAKERQVYVVGQMVENGFITTAEADTALAEALDIYPRRNWFMESVPAYTEHVRRIVLEKYGEKRLYEDGLKIYTAVDPALQAEARAAIDKGLRELDKRQGYRGPLENILPEEIEARLEELALAQGDRFPREGALGRGIVVEVDEGAQKATVRFGNKVGVISRDDIKWARKPNPKRLPSQDPVRRIGEALAVGDLIEVRAVSRKEGAESWTLSLEQTPEVQAALLCRETGTGYVRAMVGGRDFSVSEFNRAVQSRRQPGSAFKAIIYAAALDKGYTPATVIIDNAIVHKDNNRTWKPRNYDRKFYGPTLLRVALAKSRNLATIQILSDIGIDYVFDYAKRLGIRSELNRDLSSALGSSGVSLLELVGAYAVFADRGMRYPPVFITRIEDRRGNVLERAQTEGVQVIEKSTAYIMTSLLKSVITEGTGRRALALDRPAAGKTGTTNNLHDAWFVGYSPHYVSGVWVGFDQEKSMGRRETGSRAALPIWIDFMKQALADKPKKDFTAPKGVVFARIDTKTGLLPIAETRQTRFECFKKGTQPTEYTAQSGSVSDSTDFFKQNL